jgi:hypothetical protein
MGSACGGWLSGQGGTTARERRPTTGTCLELRAVCSGCDALGQAGDGAGHHAVLLGLAEVADERMRLAAAGLAIRCTAGQMQTRSMEQPLGVGGLAGSRGA